MKIAATYEKETGNIFQHFGKTQYFKLYEIEDSKIVSSQVIDNGGIFNAKCDHHGEHHSH